MNKDAEALIRKLKRRERIKLFSLVGAICLIWITMIIGAHSATNVSGITNTAVTGNVVVGGDVYYRSSIGGVPSGSILMFTTACPAGWTRQSGYDGYYINLNPTAGSLGGSTTHGHSYSHDHGTGSLYLNTGGSNHAHGGTVYLNYAGAHLHTSGCDDLCGGGGYGFWATGSYSSDPGSHQHYFLYGTGYTNQAHTHSLSGTSGSDDPGSNLASNNPTYIAVVLCKKG